MIVAGAFGHPRLWEKMLGGAERVRFRLKPVSDCAMGDFFDADGVHFGAMPLEMLDHLIPGRSSCASIKPDGLTMRTVVRAARSISGSASLSDRAAGRLEFQANAMWRPSVANNPSSGIKSTGRPVTNKSCSEKV